MSLRKLFSKRFAGFTLAELIVVVTILAVLAVIGFISLSGYSRDAADSRAKANIRSVYSIVAAESALTGNSPRYYVVHDSAASLSGGLTFIDGSPSVLTGGQYWTPGTNYSAGNPDWPKLKVNPDKFRISGLESRLARVFLPAEAAYDPSAVLLAAAELSFVQSSGKSRSVGFIQSAWIPASGIPFVVGNYPIGASGSVTGLLKDPSSPSATWALVDGFATSVPALPTAANSWSVGTWWTCSGETGTWSYATWWTCSVTCGGGTQSRTASCTRNSNGTQTRTVQCLKYDWTVLTDANCLTAKPVISQSCSQSTDAVCGTVGATSQACNTGGCPINGVCSATAGACSAGTAIGDNGASACGTTRTWTCSGLNGGANVACSKANAACVCQYQTIEYYGCIWDWVSECSANLWAWWSFNNTSTAYCVGDMSHGCYSCAGWNWVAFEWTIQCKKGCP